MSTQCLKCGYSVSEPVCASCIINEFNTWLYEQNVNKNIVKRINNEFKSLLNHVWSLDYVILPSLNPQKLSIMECIRCNREMHLMCLYCITKQASQIVKDNLTNKRSIEELHDSFNTELYEIELNKEIT